MTILKTPLTADDLLRLPDDGHRYELIDGELVVMVPASGDHGRIASRVESRLRWHVEAHNLGEVFAAETGFRLKRAPDTVMAPDVAFVVRERVPAQIPGYFEGPPDLAVEIVSPYDTRAEVKKKAWDWLAAGARRVWIVQPRRRTVTVYRSRSDIRLLTEADHLDGEDVVPGFSCPVAELFP